MIVPPFHSGPIIAAPDSLWHKIKDSKWFELIGAATDMKKWYRFIFLINDSHRNKESLEIIYYWLLSWPVSLHYFPFLITQHEGQETDGN